MKKGLTIWQTQEQYGIPRRTIDRRIKEVETMDRELYRLYKEYQKNPTDPSITDRIGRLSNDIPVILEKDATTIKLEEMQGILRQYEKLIKNNGITAYQAANQLGYLPQQIDEMRKKVNRISREIEFREKCKVTASTVSPTFKKSKLEQGINELSGLEKE